MSKKNIAIVSGGDSGEFSISVQSGLVVKKFLDPNKYKIYPILMKGTEWYHECKNLNVYTVDKNDFTIDISGEKIKFDCVFIAIHGTPGEDGKLQGYFDMLRIPYTSCDHTTSALAFNKYFCKNYISNFGVKTAKSVYITSPEKGNPNYILGELSLPLFIKPNNGGSSVGMSKVNKPGELKEAIIKAFKEDDELLAEEFIKGREITCGVMRYNHKLLLLPVTEIISKKEYFDYDAKYTPNLSDEIVPAQIPEPVYNECQEISAMLYEMLNCKGVVRFDYIFNESGVYFLEVNTVPGLTEASIVPKMAKSYGLTLQQLFSMLVEEAIGIHTIYG
jgi:D-alanine-D-alanine ligase